MKTYTAAVDLGTTKVVSLVGEKSESGYKIIAFKEAPSKGIMRGEVVNIMNVLESLNPTLQEIKEENNIEIKEVFVGIAGQHIRCTDEGCKRNRQRPDQLISQKEVDDMREEMYKTRVNAGEKILHVIPQSYNVDDHIGQTEVVGMVGSQIEGNYKIFIGRTNSAEHSKSVIARAGLKLKELVLEPVASALAVVSEEEMEMGVAMVDIGGGTTDLLIIEDNIIRHTAVIPFGGNSITEDLKQGCGVSSRNAEQMKIQYGSCITDYAPDNKTVVIPGIGGRDSREVSFKVIASIIEARVAEIVEAIMYEIERSGYQDKLAAGIVLTGGGSQLAHICNYVSYKTGYETRIASPKINITFDSPEAVSKPSSSTAVGLLIYGIENSKYDSAPLQSEGNRMIDTTLFPEEEIVAVEAPAATTEEKKKQPKAPRQNSGKFFSNVKDRIGIFFESGDNEA
ncbi:MAG: cell division protein FtsA [Bacteroidetes bacterium HGW-Bacteroidetes-14]|jgi:cell division protein FtsA|nr:MAG: cell division protein FtsA [Bacteroidetes bacterium HGW-Bacteroidetes-14]